ncbi:MAG TPA: DUF1634 domain-containing protein, partial [Geobacteraceae bacterium]
RMEAIIAVLLLCGVAISAVVVGAGGMLYLLRHGLERPDYAVFRGEPADLRTLGGIFSDVVSLRGRGMIELGVLLLVATPVARVAFSIFGFLRQRDYTYVVVTLIVLGSLLFSLSGGFR